MSYWMFNGAYRSAYPSEPWWKELQALQFEIGYDILAVIQGESDRNPFKAMENLKTHLREHERIQAAYDASRESHFESERIRGEMAR